MKKLFCLFACFCGFALDAINCDGKNFVARAGLTLVMPQRKTKVSQEFRNDKNCFCPIQNSLNCQFCPATTKRELENITPDCGDPTPEVQDCEAPSPKPESPTSDDK